MLDFPELSSNFHVTDFVNFCWTLISFAITLVYCCFYGKMKVEVGLADWAFARVAAEEEAERKDS